jgi:ribose transport system ATP-binding protein
MASEGAHVDDNDPRAEGSVGPPVSPGDESSGKLILRHLSMSFGATVALDQVSMSIQPGQVHGLVGHNGSGKSTLAKILTGYHRPDAGQLEIGGKVFDLRAEHELDQLGIVAVHQDLCLNLSMTVLENLTVAIQRGHRAIRPIPWRREAKAWSDYLQTLGVQSRLASKVSDLSPADRAGVAIARALRKLDASERKGLLIIDEATAYFSAVESARFAGILRQITARGHAVMFIGHNVNEVLSVCDVVTVLRSGQVAGTVRAKETTPDQLVVQMLGRKLESFYAGRAEDRAQPACDSPAIAVTGLTCGPAGPISFDAQAGEIVGITGIVGSGYDVLPYLLLGLGAVDGRIRLNGRAVRLNPVNAGRYGVSLVPADRAAHGVWAAGTCQENFIAGRLHQYLRGGRLSSQEITRDSAAMMSSYLVRPPNHRLQLARLSGGNQQKVLLASRIRPGATKILILHEPTQGVDVGAKRELLTIIDRLAAAGTTVLMMSADHEDLLNVCDRMLILRAGAGIVLDRAAHELTESAVLTACMGQDQSGSLV